MAHDGTGTGWTETDPQDSEFVEDAAQEMRDLRKGVRIRLEKEHSTPASSSAGGEHKAGSAKMYIQSAEPTARPDGTSLSSDDYGRLWLDTDDDKLYAYTSTGWKQVVALVADGSVTTAKLVDDSVTAAKLNADVAGDGLVQDGGDGSLDVNVDDSTLEIDTDVVRVKDGGITEAKIADGAVTRGKLGTSITDLVGAAFVLFDGNPVVNRKSSNVTSVVRNSQGKYTITLTNAMADAYYAVLATAHVPGGYNYLIASVEGTKTTTTFNIQVTTSAGFIDPEYLSVLVFGDLA